VLAGTFLIRWPDKDEPELLDLDHLRLSKDWVPEGWSPENSARPAWMNIFSKTAQNIGGGGGSGGGGGGGGGFVYRRAFGASAASESGGSLTILITRDFDCMLTSLGTPCPVHRVEKVVLLEGCLPVPVPGVGLVSCVQRELRVDLETTASGHLWLDPGMGGGGSTRHGSIVKAGSKAVGVPSGTVGTHKHHHPLFSFSLPSHAQTCNVFR
jgi:hypothetical protein